MYLMTGRNAADDVFAKLDERLWLVASPHQDHRHSHA